MKQRVKNVCYLAKVELDLDSVKNPYEAIVLPTGAEITHASLEVAEARTGATIDIGFAGNEGAILNDIALDAKATNISSFVGTTTTITKIIATLTGGTSGGKVILRVAYFLPSEIRTEY